MVCSVPLETAPLSVLTGWVVSGGVTVTSFSFSVLSGPDGSTVTSLTSELWDGRGASTGLGVWNRCPISTTSITQRASPPATASHFFILGFIFFIRASSYLPYFDKPLVISHPTMNVSGSLLLL